ncbi:NUDIX hydrolase [Phaeobacter sp. JH20_36]
MTTNTTLDHCAGIGAFTPLDARDRQMWQRLTTFCAREPRAFERDPAIGHVTGSAFVLSQDLSAVLLTHHAKLDRWLQLGGHCDGIADAGFTAWKEAYEESGLSRISRIGEQVFDIDIHEIPANGREASHLHYDVRYLFRAEAGEIRATAESKALAWVPLAELSQYSSAPSVLILKDKLARWQSGGA